jgi:uncharacterized protein (DUF433 family)
MATVVQSCRIEKSRASLLSRQAKRRNIEVSTLAAQYLEEKALEQEYPGVGFRDSAGGREAYVLGHRVAVWEVQEAQGQLGSVQKTADHFHWPPALVRSALAFAKEQPAKVASDRKSETEYPET